MLTEFFAELRNWFEKVRYVGKFKILNGQIQLSYVDNNGQTKQMSLLNGQYIRIKDSFLNDGVYEYPAENLKDEEFDGAVWSMAVPPDVIKLANDCSAYQDEYGTVGSAAMSPFTSESVEGVYSYSKQANQANSNGVGNTTDWRNVFASRLALWRKL